MRPTDPIEAAIRALGPLRVVLITQAIKLQARRRGRPPTAAEVVDGVGRAVSPVDAETVAAVAAAVGLALEQEPGPVARATMLPPP
jgi:hypothetical protein